MHEQVMEEGFITLIILFKVHQHNSMNQSIKGPTKTNSLENINLKINKNFTMVIISCYKCKNQRISNNRDKIIKSFSSINLVLNVKMLRFLSNDRRIFL